MTLGELISIQVKKPDPRIKAAAKAGWDAVAKPIDGLGDLEDIICRIASARGDLCPDISKKALVIMCADNGVVDEGISQTDQSVTSQVAGLMGEGRSSAGIMSRASSLDIIPIDIGINSDEVYPGVQAKKVRKGTRNIARGSAMTEAECLEAVRTGIETVGDCSREGYGLIAAGEMGIGNTTTAAALLCALTGADPASITGKGAGLPEGGLEHKIQVIRDALVLHLGEVEVPDDGKTTPEGTFECLRRLGGLDIAGLTGLFIGGALCGIPVVIDGLISAVAALTAERIVRGSREYMIASHSGRERGTMAALKRLGLKPVIHADLALGEGTGAILLLPMLDMAMSLYRDGAAFADTGIEQYRRFDT